jgi:hypothetical protein
MFRRSALALAIVAAAALGGCGSTGGIGALLGTNVPAPKTPKQVFAEGVGGYSVLRETANKYEALPRCPVGAPVCSDQGIVGTIEAGDAKVWGAIQKAGPVVKADNPDADTVKRVLDDLSAALTSFGTVVTPLKVN